MLFKEELISENKKGDKLKIFEKYKIGTRVDDAVIKSITDWGYFLRLTGR